MKQAIFSLFLICASLILAAQVPQAFSYQAIVLDTEGSAVTEQAVGVLVEIHDMMIDGPVIYSETHTVETNMNGVYSLSVGLGSVVSGMFTDIDWAGGSKFLSISQDVDGGANYAFVGASQLLSVPYALVAGQAEVAPKIWAHTVQNNANNVLEAYNNNASMSFNINYEWIQGEPEDIYVTYNNLPPNTNIYTRFEGGNSGFVPFDNFEAVDTFFDGLRIRNATLVVTDPNVDVIAGDYVIDIVFSTATTELATIQYPVEVLDELPTVDSECLNAQAMSSYALNTNGCTELEGVVLQELEIMRDVDNEERILLTMFEDQLFPLQVVVELNDDECEYFADSETIFIDQAIEYNVNLTSLVDTEDEIFIQIDVNGNGFDEYGEPIDIEFSCELQYEK